MTSKPFTTLPLPAALQQNLDALGYRRMTPVQEQSLPALLEGKDAIVRAQTGSGKTLAFGIGTIMKLAENESDVQGLILCPTRELAEQVAGELRRLSRHRPNIKILTLCGGVPLAPQRDSLQYGAHIVVGTPGRILDHLGKKTLSLSKVHTLVLDEADRMLDLGFHDAIMQIASHLTSSRQSLLFSATFPETIAAIASALLRDPVTVEIDNSASEVTLTQHFFKVKGEKIGTLLRLLGHYSPDSAVVFCNTKAGCDALAQALAGQGYDAPVLHGDLRQGERTEVLTRFALGGIRLLIATDVAARGLDIKELGAVINFDLPEKPETYLHRVGRTARAGSTGVALTLFTPKQQPAAERLAAAGETPFAPEDASGFPPADPAHFFPAFAVLRIDGGRKQKLRPGDLLGALCASGGIDGKAVGNIAVHDTLAYVAVEQGVADTALQQLNRGKIKGKKFRVRIAQ
ncbi:ATP-dependent RNA helicase DbpA [Sulfurimonas sp. HSL-3221]|uniref:ATP-dependent RNA helicase DbpA n=1 Tax=Sulfurimonadaceae TaxID=2771471 RepID=UPI001E6170BA|nr:ATP-dependent RNA helicase DbpA [Sulfurimonas sp. HSL-3221]UFS63334.1 ATP-dependent RNA helicase DbpA [Sulfurimonas sp. HSL-3221]